MFQWLPHGLDWVKTESYMYPEGEVKVTSYIFVIGRVYSFHKSPPTLKDNLIPIVCIRSFLCIQLYYVQKQSVLFNGIRE